MAVYLKNNVVFVLFCLYLCNCIFFLSCADCKPVVMDDVLAPSTSTVFVFFFFSLTNTYISFLTA